MWIIGFCIDRHKRGQASRTHVGAKIQTSCNIKANPCANHLFLVCCYFVRISILFLELSYCFEDSFSFCNCLSCNFNFLLRKDLLSATTTPSSSPKQLTWSPRTRSTEFRTAIEHSKVQEDSV